MISMRLLLWLKGHFVGKDSFGNAYYEERFLFSKPNRRPRRWVWYKERAEASAIPPEWHGWMHFTYEHALKEKNRNPWQKDHQSNQTGTMQAYRPSESSLFPGKRGHDKRYEAWVPNQKG